MNYRFIFKLTGAVLRYEALLMILPLAISFYYRERESQAFLISIAITLFIGYLLGVAESGAMKFNVKEGFACVAAIWILLALFGALPFYFSGRFSGFADSFFESAAAITTTGASAVSETESLPRGILFWRNFMQWIGGMGALIFVLAIIPYTGASGLHLLKAESPGPSPEKLVPRIKGTAKIMYLIYSGMTLLVIILLLLSGLPLYDSVIHAFGTASTGGFSNRNLNIGAYNNSHAEMIIIIFMFLFGINFSLYFHLIKKNYKAFLDEEFLVYIFITVASILIITFNIWSVYGGFKESLRHAAFQTVSVISTTCYSSTDYNYWPALSKSILVLLSFVGGCAGSTSGGLKILRLLIMLKAVRMEAQKIIKPRVVNTVKLNGKMVSSTLLSSVFLYFFLYVAIIVSASLLISFENKDIVSTFTAALGAMSNVGPGLEIVGPAGNFSSFTPFSKFILGFCMIAGRLEIFPLLILFSPYIWKKGAII